VKEFSAAERLIPSNIDTQDSHAYRGAIDGFHPDLGLSGWVINRNDPTAPIRLVLVVGDVVVLEFVTSTRRPGTNSAEKRGAFQEFLIEPAVFSRLSQLLKLLPKLDFSIKIFSTSFALPRPETLPRLSSIVASCEYHRDVQHTFDLYDHLATIQSTSAPLLRIPLRPRDDNCKGFIEALCTDDQAAGLIWIVGWTSRAIHDEPAVVVDGKKFGAAFSVIFFPRDDLPPGAEGFVGVLRTAWRPHFSSKPIIYFGEEAQFYLLGIPELRQIPKNEFLHHFEKAESSKRHAKLSDFKALLYGPNSWVPNSAACEHVKAAVDRLILVPECGCFAVGWVLSYVHVVQGIALKLGDTILEMDPASLRLTARTDLASTFVDAKHLSGRAGFCCFFPGRPDSRLLEAPVMKLRFGEGEALVSPIEMTKVRMLGRSEQMDFLLSLYPSIQHEFFFPSLCAAICNLQLKNSEQIQPHFIEMRKRQAIFVLPSNQTDSRLCLESIFRNAFDFLPEDCGIVLLMGRSQQEGAILSLAKALGESVGRATSVVACNDTYASVLCLRDVLMATGAERFLFVPDNCYLSEQGWRAVSDTLSNEQPGLVSFELIDPYFSREITDELACFAWTRQDFYTWSLRMPVLLEERFLKDDMPMSARMVPKGAFILAYKYPSRMAQLVNAYTRGIMQTSNSNATV
jgi:hypothetical protein